MECCNKFVIIIIIIIIIMHLFETYSCSLKFAQLKIRVSGYFFFQFGWFISWNYYYNEDLS